MSQSMTRWERANSTKWGIYLTEIEKRAILKAHDLSETPTTALEIGAEGGRWSRLLADIGWSLTCTDVDAVSLALCKRRVPAATCVLVHSDDDRIACESGSMGLILCIEVPQVMNADWFATEAARVLREGGLMTGVFFNRWSARGFIGHVKSVLTGSYDFYKHAYPSWRTDLSHNGFEVIYERGYCWPPFSRESNSVLIPHLARAERWFRLHRLKALSPWIVLIARKLPEKH